MSRCVRSVFLLSPLAALACGWLVASAASPAPPKFESARLETFAKPEGELYFSLSLHPNVPAPANAPHVAEGAGGLCAATPGLGARCEPRV